MTKRQQVRTVVFVILLAMAAVGCVQTERAAAEKTLQYLEMHRDANPEGLRRWLRHRDPEIRRLAVETLGRIQAPDQKEFLIERLSDADRRVQAAAIFALGQLFSPEAEPVLSRHLEAGTDPELKVYTIEALGKCGTEQSAALLGSYLGDANRSVRQAAAVALGQLARRGHFPRIIPPLLAQMITGPDSALAWAGAYALFRLSALRTFDDLLHGLQTPHRMARFFVLKGLHRLFTLMQSPDFAPYQSQPEYRPLVQKFQSRAMRDRVAAALKDRVWYVQVAALEALEPLRDRRYLPQIIALMRDAHPNVRRTALHMAGAFSGKETETALTALYAESSDWRIRGEALVTLARIAPKTALELVRKDWIQQAWPEIYYAIVALDSLKSPSGGREVETEATHLLIRLADSSAVAPANLAIEALIDRPNPPALDYFIQKLASGDGPMITVIANYLSLVEEPRISTAVHPLMEAYQKLVPPRDLEAMEAVITALDSIPSETAVPFLRGQLTSPYKNIREKALHALRHITGDTTLAIPRVDSTLPVRMDFPRPDADSIYFARFTTDAGIFEIELFPESAPVNVANFIHLVRSGFYNGNRFHRVVPGFVVQDGDPRGDGWGGPGYSVICEYHPYPYLRGVVGMALAGKDTGGSQFFITHTPQPHLNGRYTVLGRISRGMDVVDRLQKFDRITAAAIRTTPRNGIQK